MKRTIATILIAGVLVILTACAMAPAQAASASEAAPVTQAEALNTWARNFDPTATTATVTTRTCTRVTLRRIWEDKGRNISASRSQPFDLVIETTGNDHQVISATPATSAAPLCKGNAK